MEDRGAHGGELAAPGLLAGLGHVRRCLGGLYDEVLAGLLEDEVEVGGAVARGDADPGLLPPALLWTRAEGRGAGDLDVVSMLKVTGSPCKPYEKLAAVVEAPKVKTATMNRRTRSEELRLIQAPSPGSWWCSSGGP